MGWSYRLRSTTTNEQLRSTGPRMTRGLGRVFTLERIESKSKPEAE